MSGGDIKTHPHRLITNLISVIHTISVSVNNLPQPPSTVSQLVYHGLPATPSC